MKILPALIATFALGLAAAQAEDEAAAWEKLQDEAAQLTDGLPEDESEGTKLLAERLAAQLAHFKEFLAKYPQSANRWEARMALMQIGNSLDMLQNREPDLAAQSVELQSIADDKDAPENIQADAGLVLLQIASANFDKDRTEAAARGLSGAIAKFLETHPDDARAPALKLTEAQALETFDPARARALYEETAKNEDKEISDAAKSGLELMAMRSKPLDLSFTAVDGRKVDLADLHGKVVLVDYWATWCPPCVEEVPALVETYEKFKDKGFEIVGVSLDQDKSALEKFTKENKMTWPQFFDGKGWDNELAKRFNIQSVPTMWLLDREGKLADASPRSRLEQAVQAALDKKP
ncbi:MAG: TlpA family protein disulfide reductase [Chthoniobacterales bacterium]